MHKLRKRIQSTVELAALIRTQRQALDMTQTDLAGVSELGPRFIGDLERGKPTCQLGKTIKVLNMLGIVLEVSVPEKLNDE